MQKSMRNQRADDPGLRQSHVLLSHEAIVPGNTRQSEYKQRYHETKPSQFAQIVPGHDRTQELYFLSDFTLASPTQGQWDGVTSSQAGLPAYQPQQLNAIHQEHQLAHARGQELKKAHVTLGMRPLPLQTTTQAYYPAPQASREDPSLAANAHVKSNINVSLNEKRRE